MNSLPGINSWNKCSQHSAYTSGHSMETALLKVHDDMLRALDNQEVMCLVLIDLSTAFDTADHGIFLTCLESNFGITDTALAWSRSYLSDCSQKVVVGKAKSDPFTLTFRMPQGSMLGLILFTLYTSPLGQISIQHGIIYHLYADYQQIYLAFRSSKRETRRTVLESLKTVQVKKDVDEYQHVKLNDDKTEFTIFSTRQQFAKVQQIMIAIVDTRIHPVQYIRNLDFFHG